MEIKGLYLHEGLEEYWGGGGAIFTHARCCAISLGKRGWQEGCGELGDGCGSEGEREKKMTDG